MADNIGYHKDNFTPKDGIQNHDKTDPNTSFDTEDIPLEPDTNSTQGKDVDVKTKGESFATSDMLVGYDIKSKKNMAVLINLPKNNGVTSNINLVKLDKFRLLRKISSKKKVLQFLSPKTKGLVDLPNEIDKGFIARSTINKREGAEAYKILFGLLKEDTPRRTVNW